MKLLRILSAVHLERAQASREIPLTKAGKRTGLILALLACLCPLAATAMEMPEPIPKDPADVIHAKPFEPGMRSLKEIACQQLLDQFKSDAASNKKLIALLNNIKLLPHDIKDSLCAYLLKYHAELLESINDSQPLLLTDKLVTHTHQYSAIYVLDDSHISIFFNTATIYGGLGKFAIINYADNSITEGKTTTGYPCEAILLPNKRYIALFCKKNSQTEAVKASLYIIDLETKRKCLFWQQEEPYQEAYFTKDGHSLCIKTILPNTTVQVTTIALDNNFYANKPDAEEMDMYFVDQEKLTKTITTIDRNTSIQESLTRLAESLHKNNNFLHKTSFKENTDKSVSFSFKKGNITKTVYIDPSSIKRAQLKTKHFMSLKNIQNWIAISTNAFIHQDTCAFIPVNNCDEICITADTLLGFTRYGKKLACHDYLHGTTQDKQSQTITSHIGSFSTFAQKPMGLSPNGENVFFIDGTCLYKYATHKTLLKDSTIEELLALIIAQKEHINHKKLDPYVWNILNCSKNYRIKEILKERYAPLQPQESVASLLVHNQNVENEEEIEEINEESQSLFGCPIS